MKRKYTMLGAGVLLLIFMIWLLFASTPAQAAIMLRNSGGAGSSMYFNYALLGGTELLLIVPLLVYMAINGVGARAMMGNRTGLGQNLSAVLLGALLVPATTGLDTLMQALFRLMGATIIDTSAMILPHNVPELLAGALAIGVAAGLVEEPIFRGVAMRSLAGVTGRRAALVLSAIVFSLAHGDLVGAPSRFVAGLVLGMLFWRSGALLPGMLTHAAYNATSLGLALAVGSWQGVTVPGASAEISSLITWVGISLPFIALSFGAWRLFARLSPRSSEWGGRAYAAGEVRPAHYLSWAAFGAVTGILIIMNTVTMWLPADYLDKIMGYLK